MRTHRRLHRPNVHHWTNTLLAGLVLLGTAAPAAARRGDGPIVFESTQGGQRDIWVMEADGSNPVNLTNDKGDDLFPVWSPDGKRIAWVRGGPGPEGELWIMNADGSGKFQVTFNQFSDNNPTWSPDGLRLAFRSLRGVNRDIYAINADGTGETRLTDDPGSDFAPDWSPDGTKIAFTSSRNGHSAVYTMNADGSGQVKLTDDAQEAGLPGWSPDGEKIIYADALCATCSESDLFLMNADGSGVTQLTDSHDNEISRSWSRTGARVVMDFSTLTPSGTHYAKGDIVVLDVKSGDMVNLTHSNGIIEEHPDWSPAGVPVEPHAIESETSSMSPGEAEFGGALRIRVSPNPGQRMARLSWTLPAPGHVRLRLFDVGGRELYCLVDEWRSAGPHEVAITGRGRPQVLLYRLEWQGGVSSGKLIVMP